MGLLNIKRKTPLQKEWNALQKRELAFGEGRKNKKESALNQLLAEKVPDKLQHTLDAAFEKAFYLIFEKGKGIIEKTYNKDALEKEYKVNHYANELQGNRKSLRKFTRDANRSGNANLLLSGVSGIGMGLFGIGLPDIPVFTGMILKNIYELALHYGFDYDSETEKYFILLLIEGAVSYGDHFIAVDDRIESYVLTQQLPQGYSQPEQITKTSGMLSKELLYMKFLQGIPIVGAIGGAYDVVYMRQISEYAKIKYKKRFLLRYKAQGRI